MKYGSLPASRTGLQQARRALGVELQRLVERLLEGDGRGAVDDDVDPAADVQALVGRGRR